MQTKFFENAILKTYGINEREIRVIASTPSVDRAGDVMIPQGIILDGFKKNNPVLLNHCPDKLLGNADVEVKNNRVEALIRFAPKGVSALADEICGLSKAGVISACSVGFTPIDVEPRKGGGYTIKSWELLEISMVSVPCNQDLVVTQRSYGSSSRLDRHEREKREREIEIVRLKAGAPAPSRGVSRCRTPSAGRGLPRSAPSRSPRRRRRRR